MHCEKSETINYADNYHFGRQSGYYPNRYTGFAAQLSAQIEAGVIVGSLGKYVAVILGCNSIQFFVVLPLFLLARGLNPWSDSCVCAIVDKFMNKTVDKS